MGTLIKSLVVAVFAIGLAVMACEKPQKPEPAPQAPPPVAAPAEPSTTASGKAFYDQNCARCHGLGTYDKTGRAGDLARHVGQLSPGFIKHHRGLTVTEDDVNNLKSFVNAQR